MLVNIYEHLSVHLSGARTGRQGLAGVDLECESPPGDDDGGVIATPRLPQPLATAVLHRSNFTAWTTHVRT